MHVLRVVLLYSLNKQSVQTFHNYKQFAFVCTVDRDEDVDEDNDNAYRDPEEENTAAADDDDDGTNYYIFKSTITFEPYLHKLSMSNAITL